MGGGAESECNDRRDPETSIRVWVPMCSLWRLFSRWVCHREVSSDGKNKATNPSSRLATRVQQHPYVNGSVLERAWVPETGALAFAARPSHFSLQPLPLARQLMSLFTAALSATDVVCSRCVFGHIPESVNVRVCERVCVYVWATHWGNLGTLSA